MTEWHEAQANYRHRRDVLQNVYLQPIIDDYQEHVKKALARGWLLKDDIVLDIGCGMKRLRDCLDAAGFNGMYDGLDAFPCDDTTIAGKIEDFEVLVEKEFDTIFAFAVLDNVDSLAAALAKINRLADRSIIILTGLGIPPDDCHTTEMSLEALDAGLPGFFRDFIEYLHPKVALIHYRAK